MLLLLSSLLLLLIGTVALAVIVLAVFCRCVQQSGGECSRQV